MAHPMRAKVAAMAASKLKGYARGGRMGELQGESAGHKWHESIDDEGRKLLAKEREFERKYQRPSPEDDILPYRVDDPPLDKPPNYGRVASKRGGRVKRK